MADKIQLSRIRVNVIVGILPPERMIPQPVDINVDLTLDLNEAARTGDLSKTIDYSDILKQVSFIMHAGRFELIETAGLALVHYLLAPSATSASVSHARVTLCKRQAPRVSPALPKVTISRSREQVTINEERFGEATVQQVFTGGRVVVQRITGRPGTALAADHSGKLKSEDLDLGHGAVLRVKTQNS